MPSTHKITATRRSDAGKGASRRLRHAGQVPGILYGGELAPLNIQLNHEDIILAAKNEWFFASVLDLHVDGDVQRVLVRDWQMHPYKQHMLHLDFMRIDENAEINVTVPLHFLNQDESPAGKTSGVVIMHNLTEVEVACLSKDLPEYIEVDLTNLDEGDLIHLSELTLPEGVELTALRQGEEHDEAVVSAHAMKAAVEESAEGETETETGAEDGEGDGDAATDASGDKSGDDEG